MEKGKNQYRLGEVLKKISTNKQIAPAYNEYKIRKWWMETMGSMIAEQTKKLYFKGGTLHIYVDSASLKSELNANKNTLAESINQHLGEEAVRKVQIW